MAVPLTRILGFLVAAGAFLTATVARGDVDARQSYHLAGGDASVTLRRFADISGKEVLFATETVRRVRTNAVMGTFTAQQAIDRLLEGTILVAVIDARSGAIAVSLKGGYTKESPVPRRRTPVTLDPAEPDRVVVLEQFRVSTTLGSYQETTTSVATKTSMDLKDVPGTVQVLNAAFIEDKRAQSLEDLYPYVVGMTRESTAALGFTLRGFSNNLTNTLLNNVQTDGLPGLASRFGSPTTANVERVEVLKGPASVLYGSMNPGGIIDIVTKQPQAIRTQTYTASVASFAGQGSPLGDDLSYTATIDTSGPIDAGKRWLYRFITAFEDLRGFRQYSWGRNYYFFPSLTYRFDRNTDVTVKVDVTRQHRFSDQYLVAPFKLIENVPSHDVTYQDRRNTEYDRGDIYALIFNHRFDNLWALKVNFRGVQHSDGRTPLENRGVVSATPVEDSIVLQRWRNSWNRRRYAYYDFNYSGVVGSENFKHSLLFGASGGYETHDFRRWIFADLPGGVNVYHPIHDTHPFPYVQYDPAIGPSQDAVSKYYNYGAYFSDQLKLGKSFRASVGVRYEAYDMMYVDTAAMTRSRFTYKANSTVPSAGLVYQPQDMLSLYASYAASFKPSPPQNVDENRQGFPPEAATQVEVGAKGDFLNHQLGILLSLYDIKREHVSEAVPLVLLASNVQLYRLIGEQQSQGVEISVNYQPRPYFQLQAAYTYDDARTTASIDPALLNAPVANAPRQSANFWARYNFPGGRLRGFGVGLGWIYVGERNAVLPATPPPNATPPFLSLRTMPIPSNTRTDLAFYYRWRHYDFALNIANASDFSYIASADSEIDVVPGAPRKVTLSARYLF